MIASLFTDHPKKVNESYIEHFGFALSFSFQLFIAAGAALIHAVIPAFCEHTASRIVKELEAKTRNRSAS